MINKLKIPKIPVNSFFEPVSVEPSEEMNRTEFLFGILKKVNQIVTEINELATLIEGFDSRITTLEEGFDEFQESVLNALQEFRIAVTNEIANAIVEANAYTDVVKAQLEAEIRAIESGAIRVYDPTTGNYSPIQEVINNIYDSGRDEALTASEYDGLQLSATDYDTEELTAYDYDTRGKLLLGNA